MIDIEFGRSEFGIPDPAEDRTYWIAGGTEGGPIDEVHANYLYATGQSNAGPLLQVFGASTHLTSRVASTTGYGNFLIHNGELRIGSSVDDAAVVLRTDQEFPTEYTFDTGDEGYVGDGPVVISTPRNAAPTTIRLVGQDPNASVRIGAFENESAQSRNLLDIQSTLSIISSV